MSKKFETYVSRKFLNGHKIAKYIDDETNDVILQHECVNALTGEGYDESIGEIRMTEQEYDNLEIPDRYDTLAWMLDTFFGCNMLGLDELNNQSY